MNPDTRDQIVEIMGGNHKGMFGYVRYSSKLNGINKYPVNVFYDEECTQPLKTNSGELAVSALYSPYNLKTIREIQ